MQTTALRVMPVFHFKTKFNAIFVQAQIAPQIR